MNLAVTLLLTAFVAFVLIKAVFRPESVWLVLAATALTAWYWFNLLVRDAHRIEVTGEAVRFVGFVRTHDTTMTQIRSIARSGLQSGWSTVRYPGGRVEVARTRDLANFVALLRLVNPAVDASGFEPPRRSVFHRRSN